MYHFESQISAHLEKRKLDPNSSLDCLIMMCLLCESGDWSVYPAD